MEQSESTFAVNWKRQAQRLQKEAHVIYLVFRHPRTPWYAKLIAALTAAYLFSPIQLIPNFIPVIGSLDDFLVLFVGVKLLQRMTEADVLAECHALADAAETRKKEEIRWASSAAVSIALITVWILAGIAAIALMATYIHG